MGKLLDLGRIQAGAARPRRLCCAVDKLLHASACSLDPEGRRLSLAIAPDLPLVRADPVQLERAVANLEDPRRLRRSLSGRGTSFAVSLPIALGA